MKYKTRMALLKVLCVPLLIVTALVFIPTAIIFYAVYGIMHGDG